MDKVTDFLTDLYQGETQQGKQSQPSLEVIQESLQRLLSYGLLSDPSAMADWANALADLSTNELAAGVNKAKDFKGYLTLGEFRGMCRLPKSHASFRPYKAITYTPLDGSEIKSRISTMREELNL